MPISAYQQSQSTAGVRAPGRIAVPVPQYGQTLSQLGTIATNISNQFAQIEKDNRNVNSKKMELEYAQGLQSLLHGEEGEGGFASLQGQDVLDGLDGYLSQIDELEQNTITAAMEKDVDIEQVETAVGFRSLRAKQAAFKLAGQARLTVKKEVYTAEKDLAVSEAATDPTTTPLAVATIEEIVKDFAATTGGMDESSPAVQRQMMIERGRVIEAAMTTSLQNGDYQTAADIMARVNQDWEIDGELKNVLQTRFRDTVSQQQGLANARDAMALYPGNAGAQLEYIKEKSKDTVDAVNSLNAGFKLIEDTYDFERKLIQDSRGNVRWMEDRQKKQEDEQASMLASSIVTGLINGDFSSWNEIKETYGEDLAILKGTHQSQITGYLKNLHGPLTQPTETGMGRYIDLMTNQNERERLTADEIYGLNNIMTFPMIKQIMQARGIDQEDEKKQSWRQFGDKVKNSLYAANLTGPEWLSLRAELTNTIYDQIEDEQININDRTATDALINEVLSPRYLAAKIGQHRASAPASTTMQQKIGAILQEREIDKEEDIGAFRNMFMEIVDKQFNGTPSASQLDEIERTLLDTEFIIDGYYFGLLDSSKSIFEIYQGMDNDERRAARRALQEHGVNDPTRAQMAAYHVQKR